MSKAVLDSSAMLAVLFDEPGAERLTDEIMDDAVASMVNMAEVQSKLVAKGQHPDVAWENAISLADPAEYTLEQAKTSGTLVKLTAPFGLSLGDRCCLALAIALEAEVYTADRSWSALNLGVPIHVIR